ncbi:MAG: DNA-3-methyladenine glycosylase [Gammaproteobacteria bacterium]|nr:DNA-3-methyladenine glycosylase [Gammaproteobacteria bacterium]
MTRCDWSTTHPLLQEYHDTEWGVQLHDDQKLFEFLILEGAQAGLSWLTILKRREGYRQAFDHFNAEKIASYTLKKVEVLMQDDRIIRNRLKINSAIQNAQVFLAIKEKYGTFDQYIWQFVDGKPIIHQCQTMADVPVKTHVSDLMSKDLKKQGFSFVGSTICYAFMQAVGMVNDHLKGCFRSP